MRGVVLGGSRRHRTPVALHDMQRDVAIFFFETSCQIVHILFDDRAQVAIHNGGAGSFIFSKFGTYQRR